MRLNGVKKYETGSYIYDKEHPQGWSPPNPTVVADLEFSAVGRSKDPNDEDNYFFASTPNGHITLSVVNPAAVLQLLDGIGKEFYVDFSLAPGQEDVKPKVYETKEFRASPSY